MPIARRSLLAVAAALPLVGIGRARAAEFTYKLATNLPEQHPLNVRAQEAINRVREATGGQVEVALHPDSKLGGDTEVIKKLLSGEVELFAMSGLNLSSVVPASAINGVGFAFKDYQQVWRTMDGKLGKFVRDEITKQGPVVLARIWDNGFRQTTSSLQPVRSPDDLRNLKLRVGLSPLSVSMFTALGAHPTAMNLNRVYSALQDHTMDGQENPLALIRAAKFFEVQSYCSLTNHMWDGYWMLANQAAWARLPSRTRDIVEGEFDRSILEERADLVRLSPDVRGDLITAGLDINPVDTAPFQQVLRKAGFYAEWRGKYGETAWRLLEDSVGALS